MISELVKFEFHLAIPFGERPELEVRDTVSFARAGPSAAPPTAAAARWRGERGEVVLNGGV